jgi:hypothetical protein
MKSGLFTAVLRHRSAVLAAFTMATVMTAAHAANIVTNGSFENLTKTGVSAELGTVGGQGQDATGWTSTGYNFVFTPGSADTTGAPSQFGGAPLKLWGPGDGSNNGLTATSPDGGNYIAMDGGFSGHTDPITQLLTGLTNGQSYTVSFDWAGAQQEGANFTAPTTEAMQVGFGAATQSTVTLNNAGEGFTGWQQQSFTFTADGTSDVLSFLAVGTPDGVPPFTLLDGVDVEANTSPVPEPSSLALLLTGFAGVGGFVRSRFKKA